MRAESCYKCIYACFDPEVWLRWMWSGLPPVPMCANHPDSPGQLREVTGRPCRNFRPKPATPSGDIRRIPVGGGLYAYVGAADYDCRSNMRNCRPIENTRNRVKSLGSSSRYKGVYYCKEKRRYYATISFKDKHLWLGLFDDEIEAARAYDRKAVELGIEFARLNFPEEWPVGAEGAEGGAEGHPLV